MYPRRAAAVLVLVLLAAAPAPTLACGFANDFGAARTLCMDATDSALVVLGKLVNPRKEAGEFVSTDFQITSVIKPHPAVGKEKVLKLPSPLRVDDLANPSFLLLFCDVSNDRIEPSGGKWIRSESALVTYLKGMLPLDAKDHKRRLRYCFDYLNHPESDVAADALLEFMKTPDADIGTTARTFPPAKLRAWLQDSNTPSNRLRLYGFLLGNCGDDSDAALMRGLLEKLAKQAELPQLDGLLSGYTLLRPKEGWAYVRELIGNPGSRFGVRYACLRTVQFFYNTRSDVIGKKELVGTLGLFLGQDDISDLAIEQLRRWRNWEATDRILALYDRSAPLPPIVRHAIIRFALECPRPEAATLIVRARKAYQEVVEDQQELLQAEAAGRGQP
jgi:hypothetical protein